MRLRIRLFEQWHPGLILIFILPKEESLRSGLIRFDILLLGVIPVNLLEEAAVLTGRIPACGCQEQLVVDDGVDPLAICLLSGPDCVDPKGDARLPLQKTNP